MLKTLIRARARAKARKLQEDDDGVVRMLGRAIHATLASDVEHRERAATDAVHRLRTALNTSSEQVSIITREGGHDTRILGEISRGWSLPHLWGTLLFKLVRALRPTSCVELGTAIGISAAYQAAALRLNGSGELVTLEGQPPVASIASKNLAELGLENAAVVVGPFDETLEPTLGGLDPVDFAHIDGNHHEEPTLGYFEQFVPHLAGSAVLVFDDINWSDGMKRAWARISSDPRVRISLDLHRMGIVVLDGENLPKRHIRIPLA
jgi:predicted O-methyltransferase YrrM